jgi:hypothetical protein
MIDFFRELPGIYQDDIVDRGREPQFFLFIAFILTFIIVRFITISIRDERKLPFIRNVSAGGTHIHHLVPGIFLLLIAGYLSAALDGWWWRDIIAIFFGIGAALTLDEFALWLHLEDVYWLEQGRISLRAVMIFAGFVGIVGVGAVFFISVGAAFARAVTPG